MPNHGAGAVQSGAVAHVATTASDALRRGLTDPLQTFGVAGHDDAPAGAGAISCSRAAVDAEHTPPIAAPSRKMRHLGEMMGEGLAIGIERSERRVGGALAGLTGFGGVGGFGLAPVGGRGGVNFHNWGTINTADSGPDPYTALRGWSYSETRG